MTTETIVAIDDQFERKEMIKFMILLLKNESSVNVHVALFSFATLRQVTT